MLKQIVELGIYKDPSVNFDYNSIINSIKQPDNDRNFNKNYESLKPYYYNDVNFVPLIKSITHRKSSS